MVTCSDEKDDTAPKIWYKEDVLHSSATTEVQLDMQADLELNRVHVTPDHTLTIHNVTLDDAAVYFCHGARGEDMSLRYNYMVDGECYLCLKYFQKTWALIRYVDAHYLKS